MKLFLCSHFAKVGILLKDQVEGKTLVFIPTASINEGYKGYVGSALKLWKKLNTNIIEIEISTANMNDIHKAFEKADIIYFTGGNSFFLIDSIKKKGVDKLIKKHLENNKLYVGESGGAIICAPELTYIKKMDEVPDNFSQKDYSGLNLIDFYVLPHYLCAPFKKCSQEILASNPDLNICAINNSQAILINNGEKIELNV
ncbi:type 1 glutamine amidotransferase-like domain-containing protein [Treponema sp. OMZ 799]|uniref:Type 1 glutamine amidotransferase-like domain-containing protein n=1 Tax=Treponema sp. OMZ 799 TaxID=2563668 RepID=UPI0020A51D68|nr:Type 1 glutamine amidotransferase-like domain-containing protein [Treponema sp. OMZ 799]UTC76805.1 type 1 glutamine amidotransferase-like domain-containing protein [Treponema sp. OMZ 799]